MLKLLKSYSYWPHTILSSITIVVVIFAYLLLLSAPSFSQQQNIQLLAKQEEFPKTQQFAQQLLVDHQLNKKYYFQLVYAYQYEKNGIKNYPALDPSVVK